MNRIAISLLALTAATPALGQTTTTPSNAGAIPGAITPAIGAATTSGDDVVVTARATRCASTSSAHR